MIDLAVTVGISYSDFLKYDYRTLFRVYRAMNKRRDKEIRDAVMLAKIQAIKIRSALFDPSVFNENNVEMKETEVDKAVRIAVRDKIPRSVIFENYMRSGEMHE